MSLDTVWATQSRSGSQFLLQLSLKLLGGDAWPQSRISGSRQEGLKTERAPGFRELYDQGRGVEYFRTHGIRALKLEDPGNDDFATQVADEFPKARFLTSLRPLDQILVSHHNIKKWGHDEGYVLRSYRGAIDLFERLADEGRMFTVRIDAPGEFDIESFAEFHDMKPNGALRELVAGWEPVNDLAYQKDRWGEDYDGIRERPPGLETLRERHSWLPEIEERYRRLWERCH